MEKYTVPDEKSNELFTALSKKLSRHTCQIFEEGGAHGFKPWGTGVLIVLDNKHFILTAAHVLSGEQTSGLFIRIGGQDFIAFLGVAILSDLKVDNKIDVAFLMLHPNMLSQLSDTYDFLPIGKISPGHLLKEYSHYATFGFPEKNLKVTKEGISIVPTLSLHKISKPKVYDFYEFNLVTHILLDNKGKGINASTNKKQDNNTSPYGSSGGGIWELIQTGTRDAPVIDYSLIGIMTEFRLGKYLILAGCRIDLVLDGINSQAEKMNHMLEELNKKLAEMKRA